MNELLKYCVGKLHAEGYSDYILFNLSLALEAAKHGDSILEVDKMVNIRDITGISPSYDLFNYIDSYYGDVSLLELGEDDKNDLMNLITEYTNGI
ncbi:MULTISPECIES: hypothetical protein [unclassified Lacrimispora]|uniref:hypothetical protein n=1 Tax=unclassified Lacrimispora TaxID=2719232 RepID=UPI00377035A4